MASPAAKADRWDFFHADAVNKLYCSVYPATYDGKDKFVAEAHADRDYDLGKWSETIAVESPDPKGRHKAMKACDKWLDEAEKRVKAARPISAKPVAPAKAN